ncbi:MAG: MMPL family transporter [Lachnospiraceae bacterium]|nr:MMPL family transporter [Lachnospiraceae bacterium]
MENNAMKKISKFIVEKRALILVVFFALIIFCVLSVGKVSINSDITSLLPSDTVTRKGLTVMEKEFTTFATASVMVSNIPYDTALELKDTLDEIENISSIAFDDTAEHYASSAALFSITFSGEDSDEEVKTAMEEVKACLDGYEVSISSSVGSDYSSQLAAEMVRILLLAVLVIIAVLLFTSKSYFEVAILFIVFAVAAILNMGTNFVLGEISSITNSIAIILQLALAIDYAIIFCHRFQDEFERQADVKSALIDALAYSIIEISSSSLTTVSGLIALTLMQFRLGYDLGMVLTKGILCSLLTVFLLMPGLIMVFHKPLLRTRHKKLVPDISGWGGVLTKRVPAFLILFAIVIPFAIVGSSLCDYAFADAATDRITLSERDKVKLRIHNTFDETSTIAVLVPIGDYEKEKTLLAELEAIPEIKTATGIANIEIEDGKVLTDPYTARSFSELIGVDIEQAKLLYALYGYEHEQFQPILGDSDSYAVPLVDMMEFLFDTVDKGVVTLEEEQSKLLDSLRKTLEDGLLQLRGTNYVRMVLSATVPVEGEESYALIQQINELTKEQYGDDILVIGDITSAMDLENSFTNDNKLISLLTILFVFIVLLFTFRSVGASVMLILVIQGSIWINFSFPWLTGTNISFITYLIVTAIQMGATIDYAIVMYNRFQTHREHSAPREAMKIAVNESFPTILTSGTIMTAAGFIIAGMTTDVYISSIGLALGRGALISIILVMTVLPQILLFGNRFAEETTFDLRAILGGANDEKTE